jgi:hypothetical protein
MNPNELNTWLTSRGFVLDNQTGEWRKPKRTVPRVREAARPVAEPTPVRGGHDSVSREAIYPGRVLVRITSFCCGTQRDPDNICPKFFIDCLKHAGVIRDDSCGCIELAPIKETRVSTKAEEGCLIEVIPL